MKNAPKIKKTTIVDIARACGVSVTTVSRILNDRPDVAPETRQRVLDYIQQEGFAPQNPWKQLRSGKSRTIVLHFPQYFNPPSHEIITNASIGCGEEGYSLSILATPLSDNDLLSIFRSGQADGMILMETLTHDRRVDLLRRNNFPFVLIGRCAENSGLSFVDTDIQKGIADAIRHLVTLGHRHIGFVTLSPALEDMEYGFVTWALQGYEAACRVHQLPVLSRSGGIKTGENEALVIDLLDKHPEITAIITPQQNGISGILKAVQFKGLRIPDEISIIGLLDDSISELITPPLTSIGFSSHDMGYEAAKILISQLEKNDYSPRQILLRPELIVRASTAPARTKN